MEGGGNAFQAHSETGGMVEGGERSSKHTQSWEEWWRGAGGHPSKLRAERSGRGGLEGCQTHSVPGGVVEGARRAAKRTQSREEWWRGVRGHPSTLSTGRNGGGG